MERSSGRRATAGVAVLALGLLISALWWVIGRDTSSHERPTIATTVDEVAGFTKMGTTEHYMVVVNVLPAERMFTADEVARDHPTVGEAILRGNGAPVVAAGRHVEAHIYDRASGLPTTLVVPSIVLTDLDTGARTEIEPTLMQDVVIGAPDVHFGNNTVVAGGRDVSVSVNIAGEQVVISGHLD